MKSRHRCADLRGAPVPRDPHSHCSIEVLFNRSEPLEEFPFLALHIQQDLFLKICSDCNMIFAYYAKLMKKLNTRKIIEKALPIKWLIISLTSLGEPLFKITRYV